MLRSSSFESSSKVSNYSRNYDLPEDSRDYGSVGGGAMLPVFLNDLRRSNQNDLVELTLELDEDDSIVVCSIGAPSSNAAAVASAGGGEDVEFTGNANGFIARSLSATSRLRRKFSWLRSSSSRTSSDGDDRDPTISARDAMKLKAKLVRSKSSAQRALGGLRFISKTTGSCDANELWRNVELRFKSLAVDGLLCREDFGECIGMADSKEFALGVFDALARRRGQKARMITKEELHEFWLQISNQSFDARLQIFFDMADSNEDGRITRDEVQELIMLSASANKLSKLKERAEEYASLIMEELDPENLGYIELWQLEALLLQRETYMSYSQTLSVASIGWSQNISSNSTLIRSKNALRRQIIKLKCIALENWQRICILFPWIMAMAALFGWKFYQYKQKDAFQVLGYCLPTAKGAAETLKLNMALILIPVCRNTLTWLRSTRARLFIPFDDNINFHKVIAFAIAIGIVIHAGVHLTCDFPRLINSSPEKFALVAMDFNGVKPTYNDLLTGVEGATGISMVILATIAFTLATRHLRRNVVKLPAPFNRLTGFNAFWFSHHLFALVYILLLVHGTFLFFVHRWYKKTPHYSFTSSNIVTISMSNSAKNCHIIMLYFCGKKKYTDQSSKTYNTWMYISVPLFLYVAERSLRTCRSEHYLVKILKVSVLPGDVFSLVMSKPNGFKYKSGQYIFLQCPTISPFEWHPFSITSAPGDDYLSVHIRTVGDWTQELKRVFTEDNGSASVIGRAKFTLGNNVNQRGLPRLYVDGPYGAPAQDYQNYDVLLLVGLGIGATPFISILKDLLNNTRTEDQVDSNTETSGSDDSLNSFVSSSVNVSSEKKKSQKTRRAHFYWVTREPGSFEWFEGVMNEVAEMDHKGQIEMHNYLTSVYEEGDARSTLITMVQALNHAKHGVDILSGTRVRTHFARPNWKEVFNKIASKHPLTTIGVFYCGLPVLAKELKQLSHELTHKTSTRFEFHKEYF